MHVNASFGWGSIIMQPTSHYCVEAWGVSVKQTLHYYARGSHYYEDAQNGNNAIQ